MRKKLLLSLLAAMCCMSMWAQTPEVTGITLAPENPTAGDEITFTATVDNFTGEPTIAYEVKAAEGEYEQAQGGKFTPTEAGTYWVKATAFYLPDEGDPEEAYKEQEFVVLKALEVGDEFTDETSGLEFKITALSESSNTVTVTGCGTTVTACTIPAAVTYRSVEFSVNAIAEGAFQSSGVTAVTIPASVTSIGKEAFKECASLASVTFADDCALTSIGEGVFASTGLTAITIPASVTSIEKDAFNGCASLASVTFADGSQLESFGEGAFQSSGVTAVTIPASVTSIGKNAFNDCASLDGVTFADGSLLESIGDGAFAGDVKLWHSPYSLTYKSLYLALPISLKSIGAEAFKGCTELKELSFGGTSSLLESIGDGAFAGTGLTRISIPATVTSMGAEAFKGCTSMTTANFAADAALKSISEGAFAGDEKLTAVTIPASITSIEKDAFNGCSALASVTFADGSALESIGESAFAGAESLAKITIPSTVTSIGAAAFNGAGITFVNIPVSVESIGDGAFADLTASVTTFSVYWTESTQLPTLGTGAFGAGTQLLIPIGTTDIYSTWGYDIAAEVVLFADAKVEEICLKKWDTNKDGRLSVSEVEAVTDLGTVFKYNEDIVSFDELKYFTGLTTIPEDAFLWATSITSVTIPASVTLIDDWAFYCCRCLETFTFAAGSQLEKIGKDAFSGCESLTAIDIPASVTSIGDEAFEGTALTTIELPASLESIGSSPFWNCGSLESITFADGFAMADLTGLFDQTSFKTIEVPSFAKSVSFKYCKNLETVTFAEGCQLTSLADYAFAACRNLKSIEIPASVDSIGENAFEYCTFESITIPATVKTIKSDAFFYAHIGTIVFEGTPESIDYSAFNGSSGLYCFTSDEDPVPNPDPVFRMYSLLLFGEEKTAEELTADEKEAIIAEAEEDGWEYTATTSLDYLCDWYWECLWEEQKTVEELTDEDIAALIQCAKEYYDYSEETFRNSSIMPRLVLPADWSGEDYNEDSWYGGCFTLVEKTQEVTEVGWTSMYLDYNYTLPVGTVAFYASQSEGSQITLEPIKGVIPANTGVIIRAPKGSTLSITKTTDDPTTSITGNLFSGVTEDTDTDKIGDVYVLSPATTESNPVFQNYTGAKLGANKAYIPKSALDASASNTLRFVINGNKDKATHIDTVIRNDANADAPMYNLQGQRVSDDYRGIVVKNGRKVMVR